MLSQVTHHDVRLSLRETHLAEFRGREVEIACRISGRDPPHITREEERLLRLLHKHGYLSARPGAIDAALHMLRNADPAVDPDLHGPDDPGHRWRSHAEL